MLGRGLRVLGQAIRDEPRLFTYGVVGSSLFGLLIIANSYVVGGVVGHVVVPAFASRHADTGTLALVAAIFLGISVLRVASIFGRRLGAGFMQFRLREFPRMFPNGAYPPNTLLMIDRLVGEAFLVEVKVVAAL